ncbi:MAG: hypothetical protein GY898_30055 [Proteobacteria bacterium]|nr:hypothetical protein [Pseudomonadota bacterium]
MAHLTRSVSLLTTLTAGLALSGCYGTIFGEPDEADLQPAWAHPDGSNDDGSDNGLEDPIDDGTTTDDDDDDGIGDPIDLTNALRGVVQDPLGIPVEGVAVVIDGELAATTDAAGRFALSDQEDESLVVMGFAKSGFGTSWSEYVYRDGGHNYFVQTLARVDLVVEFDSADGADFDVDGTHSFELPGDTILDADGLPFDGNVTLEVTVWDRTTPLDEGGEFLASPGQGTGVDELGDDQLLYTYGMFQVRLTSDEGGQLKAGPGIRVQVDVPADSNVEGDDQVPFWDFDEQSDEWVEAGQGRIVELSGGDQVWEFEPTDGLQVRQTTTEEILVPVMTQATCNPDQIVTMVRQEQEVAGQATGKVTDQTGAPVPNAQVRLISEDQTYMVRTQTDSDGDFVATVPPQVANPVGPNGRALFMEVDYEAAGQPFLWRTDPVDPPGANGTMDFGVADLGSMTCVRGTVRDASGAPVDGLAVATSHGGSGSTDASGEYCMQVPKWQPASVYALPTVDSAVGFQPDRTRPAPTSGGSCDSACPNTMDLLAVPATACVTGQVMVGEYEGDGLRVEAFDARFPSAPVFSTVVSGGQFELAIPAGADVSVRVGAGDNSGANACASQAVAPREPGDACVILPMMDCGE